VAAGVAGSSAKGGRKSDASPDCSCGGLHHGCCTSSVAFSRGRGRPSASWGMMFSLQSANTIWFLAGSTRIPEAASAPYPIIMWNALSGRACRRFRCTEFVFAGPRDSESSASRAVLCSRPPAVGLCRPGCVGGRGAFIVGHRTLSSRSWTRHASPEQPSTSFRRVW
jgi:hypothetical protein